MIPATIVAITSFNYWNNRRIASTYYGRITPLLYTFENFFKINKNLRKSGEYAFRDYTPGQGSDFVEIELSTLLYNTLPTKIAGIIALIVTTCLLITKKCSPSAAALSTIWSGFITFYKIREQSKLHHLKARTFELSKTRWILDSDFRQLEWRDPSSHLYYRLRIEKRENYRLGSKFFRKALLDFTLSNYSFSHSMETKARSLGIPILDLNEKIYRTIVFNAAAAKTYDTLRYESFRKRFP